MAGIGKIARRGVLLGSLATAGGVAFGAYLVWRDPENPLAETLSKGEASFNPWVKITPDGIILITPHAELGQGVEHMQALLLAEELDLEIGQFETRFGSPSPAYYNTAMAAEGAPFRTTDTGTLAEIARGALGAVGKVMGLQGTGGSTSVPDSFDKLRSAGAMARETLKLAAAGLHGVDVKDLSTQSGSVILPDGQRIPYQALASAAAGLEPVENVAHRNPSEWRLIGSFQPRPDIIAKSTGLQRYGIDMQREGLVHAALRLSPTRGKSLRADLSAAKAMEGVSHVLTLTDGFAVIADNTWTAMQAAEAIDVDWEEAAYPSEQEEHWQRLSDALSSAHLDREWRADGDVDGLPEERAITAEYRAPYVAHQPLEPLNATILVNDDQVEVWAAHQLPPMAQRAIARVTGHETDQVIFHNQHAGGSFGHRLEFENLQYAAEIGGQLRGIPVKLTYRREEDFARDFPRHIAMAKCAGSVRDGQVEGIDLQIAAPSPVASQLGRIGLPMLGLDNQLPAGAWNAPYALEHFRVRTYRAEGLAPVSSWRSVGASTNGFFLECFLDELIHAAGADPMDERLRLCAWDVARGVLEEVALMSNWGRSLPSGSGRGLALVESFGVPVAQCVEVSQMAAGLRIDHVWVAADAGPVIDPLNFEAQIQGGVIWGLGHALNSEITYRDGVAEQTNYHDAEGLRLYQTPQIDVRWREQNFSIRGIGEPPVPPAAPALANAVFAATGQRLRQMPFGNFASFA